MHIPNPSSPEISSSSSIPERVVGVGEDLFGNVTVTARSFKVRSVDFFQKLGVLLVEDLSCTLSTLFLLDWTCVSVKCRRCSRVRCAFSHSAAQSASVSGSLTVSSILSHSLHHSVADERVVEKGALNGFAPPSPVSSSQLLSQSLTQLSSTRYELTN